MVWWRLQRYTLRYVAAKADGMITDTHSRAAGGTRLALLAEECSASCQTRFQQELHNKNMFDLLVCTQVVVVVVVVSINRKSQQEKY